MFPFIHVFHLINSINTKKKIYFIFYVHPLFWKVFFSTIYSRCSLERRRFFMMSSVERLYCLISLFSISFSACFDSSSRSYIRLDLFRYKIVFFCFISYTWVNGLINHSVAELLIYLLLMHSADERLMLHAIQIITGNFKLFLLWVDFQIQIFR